MDPRLEFIHARRSIRRYSSESVEETAVHSLLEAAFAAPSALDSRPSRFVVVREREVLDRIGEFYIHYKMLKEASLAIVVCADPSRSPDWWIQDAAAATQNILLAAAALGLGSVWLGVHPREDRKTFVRQTLGIPKTIEVLSMVSVGHPMEEPKSQSRYEEDWVHYDRW